MSVFGRVAAMGFAAAWVTSAPVLAIGAELDATLPDYRRVDGVAGNLPSVGSDTLANLMTLWAEAFKREYPNVTVQIQAGGSSTAPPALIEGTSRIGPMSRKMKAGEEDAFEARYGYKPGAVRVAADVLAVFVNRDNPIAGMTIPQVDAVFSSTRKCGYPVAVTQWGQLGLTGPWKNRPIQRYGRDSASGTYGYFKENAMCEGDYRTTVNEQPGSASVVQAVTRSLNGIGYAGIGYRTSGVRAIPLAGKAGDKFVELTPDNAITGSYPLARFLYVYFNKHPNGPLPLLEKEFLTLVLSKTGQQIVVKDGYIPLPAGIVKEELAKLE
jgi:phosphate transport system substrate-binding protein